MVDQFTLDQFQSALDYTFPGQYARVGVKDGEWVFRVYCDPLVAVEVRSSVHSNGLSAAAGQDSIRLWLVVSHDGKPLAPKIDTYTTRVAGWERRMAEKMEWLRAVRISAGNCPDCGRPKQVFRSTTEKNPNRLFAKCLAHNHFAWVEPQPVVLTGQTAPVPTSTETDERETGKQTDLAPLPLSVSVAAGTRDRVEPSVALKNRGSDGFSGAANPRIGKASVETLYEALLEEGAETPIPVTPAPVPVREPNAEQQQAIEAPVKGAVRVLAGPGSGKTFVLARRYAYLVSHGVAPEQIVAVTFSRTMADELAERIGQLTALSEQAVGQVCTIHALCYRILKAEGDPRKVAKEWQQKVILHEAPRDGSSLIEQLWGGSELPGYTEVATYINAVKQAGIEAGSRGEYQFYAQRAGEQNAQRLVKARAAFDAELKRQQLLTFADMLLDADTRLQRDEAFRLRWQGKWTHLLLDEAQDTSAQAMRILTVLAAPQDNVMAVGDPDQLLYRFAGATPEANLFDGFEAHYPDALTVHLATNYRSTHAIVETQLRLIAHNYAGHGGPYEQRYQKALAARPDALQGDPVMWAEYDTPEDEARALAQEVMDEITSGTRAPGSYFVGARTRAQLGYLEGPLTRAGVPYVNICGGSFWTQKHVADTVAYVALAADPNDAAAFARVYNVASSEMTHPWGTRKGEYCSHRYLGQQFLAACGGGMGGMERAVRGRRAWQPGAEDLTLLVGEIQAGLAESTAQAVRVVIERCYRAWLQAEEGLVTSDEAENGKLADLDTVVELAGAAGDATAFLAQVRQMQQQAVDAQDRSQWGRYVVLSTIHRLKGLERDVVYGIGLSEGVQVVKRGGVEIEEPRGLLPHTFSLIDPPQIGVLPTGGRGRVEDERCCAFVLVSRAREECRLSGVKQYRKASMWAGRFVKEMGL